MPEIHSKFSASGTDRWLACPASVEEPSVESKSSEYAAEGTVAHALAEHCWMLGVPPSEFIGQPRSCDGYTITIDTEMAEAVQIYLDVLEDATESATGVVETRIEHSKLAGFGGTLDFGVPAQQHIIDFKYGAGVTVEAEGNAQLSSYALLFCDYFQNGRILDTEITIVQPRTNHPDGPIRSWKADREYLADFYERVSKVINGVRAEELHAGDHCRWCPRAVNCPELSELTLRMAKSDFDADQMTPDKAAEVLAMRKAVKTYIEGVEAWVKGRLELGDSIPGYKLVDTYHNRKYAIDENEIVRRCRNKKFGKKQIYETRLMSPAQLEKVVGKELVTGMVERPHKGTTVVPESDRRKAVERKPASEEFESCESE
ncbi:PD-(D/E)XK nuclease superfamily protein [Stieleria maiorica]|uniref:PD-(D/E)XK nuclease superfamily protein n=1 Tax=Stieleria maiorica TaxID=2795974 RepID=A0A5B9MCE0_9BACT|nr:DUF2800 domain-containing protein [Stieleria maiorica]QEF98179.1 PD-(D/E)XK nuclease superfamily protein [Stieleria maiorica]